MFNKTKVSYYKLGAAMTVGLMAASSGTAHAANNFSSIASNINTSMSSLPALISAVAYLFGVLLCVLGIMKIKDHVENPTQTPLKEGTIRLICGGALFALPILTEAMLSSMNNGATGAAATTATLTSVTFVTS
ncbi:MAG: hypothetical protein COA45_06175 [Zetaproteobacteria bacterium]|nr:MAG: hypothetical protein COA45_06175 [Zetaproteobacteria bacterium]